ncbi:MAG: DUF2167 domain-containing protein [Planctomycetes bacterium]|nr:DUF2167 domain-containing protein [Planctomycetota bacterium]
MRMQTRAAAGGVGRLAWLVCLGLFTAAVALAAPRAWAQEDEAGKPAAGAPTPDAAKDEESGAAEGEKIAWTHGPATADVGTMAQIVLEKGYRWVGPAETQRILESMGNPTSGKELALVSPQGGGWFAVFEFDETGYVKDDDKDKLDADALLTSIRKGNEGGNELRRKRGWGELEIVGWEVKPSYNAETNNLEWAIRCREAKSGDSINYNVRLLGRAGVMEATLVVDPEDMAKDLPDFRKLLANFSYKSGSKYSEWRSGDKIAAYGLAALVAGGAAAAAAKSGLLGKLIKPLILGLAAIGVFFKKMFGQLFGPKTVDPSNPNSTPPVS